MSHRTVFYSWQSDRENSVARGLINKALADAVAKLGEEDPLMLDVRVDKDTQDVPGSPEIAQTIFEKIDVAAVFVADVTFVDDPIDAAVPTKRCPNPNVLVELGWAAKTLGWDRVILVMNEHYGPITDLPFDLPRRRVAAYVAKPGEEYQAERRTARAALRSCPATWCNWRP